MPQSMATKFTAKKGTSLSGLKVKLIDGDGKPLDLTDASAVLLYVRKEGSTANLIDGLSCSVLAPASDEAYAQRVTGPDTAVSDTGSFRSYFKVAYGPTTERVPSSGYLWLHLEENFE